MVKKTFTIIIPVKPYIRQWLLVKHHCNSQTLILAAESEFKIYIEQLLTNQLRDRDSQYAGYASEIKIVLPLRTLYKKGFDITKTSISIFNQFAEQRFKAEFCYYVSTLTTYAKMDIQNAIEAYMEEYKLEDDVDIKYDSLKKIYYRFRKRQIACKLYNNLTPAPNQPRTAHA